MLIRCGALSRFFRLFVRIIAFLIVLIAFGIWIENMFLNASRQNPDFLCSTYPIFNIWKRYEYLFVSLFRPDKYPCPNNMRDLIVNERIWPPLPRLTDPPSDCTGNDCGVEWVVYATRCKCLLFPRYPIFMGSFLSFFLFSFGGYINPLYQ